MLKVILMKASLLDASFPTCDSLLLIICCFHAHPTILVLKIRAALKVIHVSALITPSISTFIAALFVKIIHFAPVRVSLFRSSSQILFILIRKSKRLDDIMPSHPLLIPIASLVPPQGLISSIAGHLNSVLTSQFHSNVFL
jgi:hypothetical protein